MMEESVKENIKERCLSRENTVYLIKQLIKDEQYDGINLLFTAVKEFQRNAENISMLSMELYQEICYNNINNRIHEENLALYSRAEDLLKIIAAYAPIDELMLELLGLIEEQKSHHVFSTALRALQILLLRQSNSEKSRALDWTLSSIQTYLEELPLPDYLKEGYDVKEKQLLEQDEKILNYLTHHITVGLFYEPLLNDICRNEPTSTKNIYHLRSLSRRNVLCCFLVNLLGEPLSCLNLDITDQRKTNTYTLQCAVSLTKAVTKCIVDPYFFMSIIQERVRWKVKSKKESNCTKTYYDIFLLENRLPVQSVAIYYYMILVGKVDQEKVPLVYHPMFVCESMLHVSHSLLCSDIAPLHEKGLNLAECLFQQLHETYKLSIMDLELELHKSVLQTLCNLVSYSPHIHIRKKGLSLLRQYILKFEHNGIYVILKNLLRCITHSGITGFLIVIYKDLVAEALLSNNLQIPKCFSGEKFRSMLLQNICHLPKGLETDLIDQADRIISCLNIIRLLGLMDHNNRTGFWDFITDIEKKYIIPLRNGLKLSVVHCQAELKRIENGEKNLFEEIRQYEPLQQLDVSIGNGLEKSTVDLEFTKEEKICLLQKNLCTFDLINFLLAKVTDCLENKSKSEFK